MARSSIVGVNEYQRYVCSIIPQLDYSLHKGQCGRIGVVGGSEVYSGAPFFVGQAALKLGADLVYVLTERSPAQVIKSYSPEFCVLPYLDSERPLEHVESFLGRLHSLVIGPGLSTDERTQDVVSEIIGKAKEKNLPIILDASVLPLICKKPELIKGYRNAILTPNANELRNLYSAIFKSELENITPEIVESMGVELGHLTILSKGEVDIIGDGLTMTFCDEQGSPRRCGGQGDALCGLLATFAWWAKSSVQKGAFHKSCHHHPSIVAALGASMVTRRSARNAFKRMHRGTLTSDLLEEIKDSFTALFPVD